jgi:hypothetical protein
VISCSPRYVEITHPSGHIIRCKPNQGKIVSKFCALEAKTVEEVPIVNEYPDVFPEELPGMPPNRNVEFVIDLLPGTGLIAKRPYRMSVEGLEELGVVRQGVHQTQCFTLGFPCFVHEKEGWIHEDVH